MDTFEYITALVAVVIGLAIADLATSLHRLLRNRKRVRWDWVSPLAALLILETKESWYRNRQPMLEERVRERLGELSDYLGDREWLDGEFSAGDLLMVTVLRRLESSNLPDGPQLLAEFPIMEAYVAHGEGRPAYKRAFESQLRDFLTSKAT